MKTEISLMEKVEDVFESARQAFFSNGNGQQPTLAKHQTFTQVKSYDGPVREINKK